MRKAPTGGVCERPLRGGLRGVEGWVASVEVKDSRSISLELGRD